MTLEIIILMVCSTTFTLCSAHELKIPVGINRTNRDIKVFQETNIDSVPEYQPPVFNYQTARQMAIQFQDHQKQRYSQQQQIDVKNGLFMKNHISPMVHQLASGKNLQEHKAWYPVEWQPFQPTPFPKNVAVQRKAKNTRLRINRTTKPKHNKIKSYDFSDLNSAGSENTETKKPMDRQDIPDSNRIAGDVVYIPPALLQEVLGNSNNVLSSGNFNGHEISKVDYSALSDLIGKNPNVQLEGLKQLLRASPVNTPIFPVIQGPQPFKVIDHKPITENAADIPNVNTRPNIKVDHEHSSRISSIIPTSPVDQNTLESIQKQLDEASKLDANEAFSRAEEQARAHVEAQHKAIEKAQQAIFEEVQKSLKNPEASPLVQINSQFLNQPFSFSPTPIPEGSSTVSFVPTLTVNTPQETGSSNPVLKDTTTKKPLSEHLFSPATSTKLVQVTPPISKTPLHQYPSKNVQYYAPNHIHQAATQLQAEKTLMAQVKSQNKAILNGIQPPMMEKRIRNENIHKVPYEELTQAQTYQQFGLETQPEETKGVYSSSAKQLSGTDNNVQYAANYAFGYRIKDAKEGNDFGHQEKRQGKSTQGRYYVLLPDGRKQHVEYYADDSGYHAKVSYEKIAHHR